MKNYFGPGDFSSSYETILSYNNSQANKSNPFVKMLIPINVTDYPPALLIAFLLLYSSVALAVTSFSGSLRFSAIDECLEF